MDVFNTKRKKGKKYNDSFLLIPGNIVDNRQVVDIFKAENFLQLQCDDGK